MALFFQTLENTDDLVNALKAYKQALLDISEAANNPDLHHNIATVLAFFILKDRMIFTFFFFSLNFNYLLPLYLLCFITFRYLNFMLKHSE